MYVRLCFVRRVGWQFVVVCACLCLFVHVPVRAGHVRSCLGRCLVCSCGFWCCCFCFLARSAQAGVILFSSGHQGMLRAPVAGCFLQVAVLCFPSCWVGTYMLRLCVLGVSWLPSCLLSLPSTGSAVCVCAFVCCAFVWACALFCVFVLLASASWAGSLGMTRLTCCCGCCLVVSFLLPHKFVVFACLCFVCSVCQAWPSACLVCMSLCWAFGCCSFVRVLSSCGVCVFWFVVVCLCAEFPMLCVFPCVVAPVHQFSKPRRVMVRWFCVL